MAVSFAAGFGAWALPVAGTLGAAFTPLLVSSAINETVIVAVASGAVTRGVTGALKTAITLSCTGVMKKGHYANGDWVHVRGGPKRDVPMEQWEAMRFEG